MAESNSFKLFCLHANVPAVVYKEIYLIKTKVLIFTKFGDDKTPKKSANVFSKSLCTVTVIFKTDVLNHNAVPSHSLRTFSLNKRQTDI